MNAKAIKNYWTIAPADRNKILTTVKSADLEYHALINNMVVYKGKLYKPEDCPCGCEMEAPDQCFNQTLKIRPATWTAEEKKDKECHCVCHTFYEPF